MLTHEDLCETLTLRAQWTGDIIAKGISSQLGVLEETITDVNLIEVATRHENHILTKKFSRKQEGSESGADWVWCIGEPGSWLILLVQAKIVNPYSGTCRYLNYLKGKQCSMLVSYARKIKAVPLYVIYSRIPTGYQPRPKASPNFSTIDSDQWSCAWLKPRVVKRLNRAKKNKIEDVLSESIPWALPFCKAQMYSGLGFGDGLAHGMRESFNDLKDEHLVPSVSVENSAKQQQIEPRKQWDTIDPTTVVNQDHFPRTIQRLISLGSSDRPPVAGVGIISARPLEQINGVKAIIKDSSTVAFYSPVTEKNPIYRNDG